MRNQGETRVFGVSSMFHAFVAVVSSRMAATKLTMISFSSVGKLQGAAFQIAAMTYSTTTCYYHPLDLILLGLGASASSNGFRFLSISFITVPALLWDSLLLLPVCRKFFSNSHLQASVLRQTIVPCNTQRVACGFFCLGTPSVGS